AATQVARATGLANAYVLVVEVAHLTDGRHAIQMHQALLAGGQTHNRVIALFRHQLRLTTRATHDLTTAPLMQLDVVDHRAGWDIAERQRIADANLGLWSAHHTVADLEAVWRDDVAFLAIQVVQQGDARRTVRVILNREDIRRDAKLVALEIDQAILLL